MRDEEDEARLPTPSRSLQIGTVASLRCRIDGLLASDVIGAIDFSETGEFFATGGIARKIRICSYTALTADKGLWDGRGGADEEEEDKEVEEDDEDEDHRRSSKRSRQGTSSSGSRMGFNLLDHESSSVAMMCTPAKLSSVKWVPGMPELLGCGDYDGVVTEWNVETGVPVSERHEHGGLPVWSIDYSTSSRYFSASAAGDGCVRLWSRDTERSVGAIRSPRGKTMCCAEFNPADSELLAVACADGNIYLYDLRSLQAPLCTVGQHDRAASYVRFMGKDKLVSASVDSTIKLWDISTDCWVPVYASQHPALGPLHATDNFRLIRTFSAHVNAKNFVGLSVLPDAGLVASGSETNDVFVYQTSAEDPVWRSQFADTSSSARYDGSHHKSRDSSFVAAVCWKQQHDHYALVAANSDGIVQIIQARLD